MVRDGRTGRAAILAAAVAVGTVAGGSVGARAQTEVCAPDTAGTVACIAGRLCACGFSRGSPATGLPDGFRWDCGILRPSCGAPAPATLDPWQGPLPDSLTFQTTAPRRPRPEAWEPPRAPW